MTDATTPDTPDSSSVTRCPWVGPQPIYVRYHDEEWGVPLADERQLFKKLVLEGFQAGLSWITILNKRKRFEQVFAGFDPEKIARFGEAQIENLMQDKGIVRNRAKIKATIGNARAYLKMREQHSLGYFFWDFVDGSPINSAVRRIEDIPAQTGLSKTIAKTLKQRGFRFCGPVGVYAMMQSAGLVNDHLIDCHRYQPCLRLAEQFEAPKW